MNRGHAAPFLYPGYEDILAITGEYLRETITAGGDLDGVFELMDSIRQDAAKNKNNSVLGHGERGSDYGANLPAGGQRPLRHGTGDIALCTAAYPGHSPGGDG